MKQEFVQAIQNSIMSCIHGIHTAMPGEILNFDKSTGTATVKPAIRFRKPNGETMDFPQITGVPVCFPQGNGQRATIAFPVKAGDGCLLVISERSLDFWLYGQETDTELAFDLSNAMCIPGLFVKNNPVLADACESNAIIAAVKNTRLCIKDGEVLIDAAQVVINGDLKVNGEVRNTGEETSVE